MKKTFSFLIPALTCCFHTSSLAQDVHPDLKLAVSKVNTQAEYVKMNRLSGDLSAITEYLELIITAARANGEDLPDTLKAKDLVKILGLNTIKATAESSTKQDNAWINHAYLDQGGNDSGFFSLLGEKNQAYIAPSICPEGTDIVLQMQLDLRHSKQMITEIANLFQAEDQLKEQIDQPIPQLGMTPAEVLAKTNLRINFMLDLDANDQIPTPFGKVGRPFAAARIDGIAWLWEKLGKQALKDSQAPIQIEEKDGLIVLTPNAEAREQMQQGKNAAVTATLKLSPMAVIDPINNHVWITTNEAFLAKCKSGENTLANSATFKSAVEGFPNTANSMAYVSKDLLTEVANKYAKLAETGMLGEDFDKAKPLVDRLMVDITESDKGWASIFTKDDNGLLSINRGPFAAKHLQYLSGFTPLIINAYQEFERNSAEDIDKQAIRFSGAKTGQQMPRESHSKV